MTVLNCNVVPINIAETNLCTINLFEKQRPWHTKVLMQDGALCAVNTFNTGSCANLSITKK